eukprot:gene10030-2349_t
MRVKLQFDEELSSPFPKCMYFVDKSIKNIEKLRQKIEEDFEFLYNLNRGIQLEINDFVLPPNQPIHIITEEDIITIKKKRIVVGEDREKSFEKKEKKKRKIELIHDIKEKKSEEEKKQQKKKKKKVKESFENLDLSSIEKVQENSNENSFQQDFSSKNISYENESFQKEVEEENSMFNEENSFNQNSAKKKKRRKKNKGDDSFNIKKRIEYPERDYSNFNPYQKEQPMIGDIIAYQKYELSEFGTPKISNFKEGKIIEFNPNNKIIRLEHLYPPKEIQFELNENSGNFSQIEYDSKLIIEEIFDKLFNILEIIKPKIGDEVKIKSGEFENQIGICIGMDENDNSCVIKIDDNHVIIDSNNLILN